MRFNCPLSPTLAARLIDFLQLPADAVVLDVGCGNGAFLIDTLARYTDASGVGLDQDPALIARAEADAAAARADIAPRSRWIAGDAKKLADATGLGPASIDLAVCLGASHAFAWDDVAWPATLDALIPLLRPGGLLLLGEGLWEQPPPEDYLAFLGPRPGCYRTHADHVADLRARDMIPLYATTSTLRDWDNFEWTHQLNAERALMAEPDNPDHRARVERTRRWRDAYMRWGRGVMGFGFYLAAKPAA